jgi:serine/threonine protein kinase
MATINLGIAGLEIIEQVGKGGSSRVFRARQQDLDREVAVKVMNVGNDPEVLRQFERERRTMDRLSLNDGIVPVYSSGLTDQGLPYLVMPYYPDGSLAERMADGPVGWRDAVDHMIAVARTMGTTHEAHVVHLDLKPGNILLSPDGTPWIADFGIAKLLGDRTASRTTATTSSFTPAYSAPETLMGGEVSPAADVYGLGATLWALLAGEPPFRSDVGENTLMAVIGRVVHEAPGDLRSRVPEHICQVVETAMAKEPVDRHPTAGAFSRALLAARQAADRDTDPRGLEPLIPPPHGIRPADPVISGHPPSPTPPAPAAPPTEAVAPAASTSREATPARPSSALRFDEPRPPRFVPAVGPSGLDDALRRYGPTATFLSSVLVLVVALFLVTGHQAGHTNPTTNSSWLRSEPDVEEAEPDPAFEEADFLRQEPNDDQLAPSGPSTSDPSPMSGGNPPATISRDRSATTDGPGSGAGSGSQTGAPDPGGPEPTTAPTPAPTIPSTAQPPTSQATTTTRPAPTTTSASTTAPTTSVPAPSTATTETTPDPTEPEPAPEPQPTPDPGGTSTSVSDGATTTSDD